MSQIVVDLGDPTPPYEQVRRGVLTQIVSGRLRPGDRLPTIRALASDLGLAPGTVARAYKLLEEAQLITTRRGAGTTVASRGDGTQVPTVADDARLTTADSNETLAAKSAAHVAAARATGHSDREILHAVHAALSDPHQPRRATDQQPARSDSPR